MPGDLILLHGFAQTGTSWDGVRRALGTRYRSLAPDLPGHGAAARRRPVTLGAVLAHLLALAPATFTLAGYSMGGRIALHAALALPGRIERLTLVSAGPGLPDPGERAARRAADEALAERIEAGGIERFADEWAAQPLFADQPRGVVALAREDRLRNTPAGLAAALRGLGTGVLEPVAARLGELAMPVVLVVGERDAKFRAVAERMLPALGDGRLVVVPGAGHAVALDQPEALAALL